jgi:hypothetical protein
MPQDKPPRWQAAVQEKGAWARLYAGSVPYAMYRP